jgi:hypothetical protein
MKTGFLSGPSGLFVGNIIYVVEDVGNDDLSFAVVIAIIGSRSDFWLTILMGQKMVDFFFSGFEKGQGGTTLLVDCAEQHTSNMKQYTALGYEG